MQQNIHRIGKIKLIEMIRLERDLYRIKETVKRNEISIFNSIGVAQEDGCQQIDELKLNNKNHLKTQEHIAFLVELRNHFVSVLQRRFFVV